MIQYFAFLLISFLSYAASAQDPSYFVIGAKELANVDIYSLLYDDESDVLYAGTNRGVYKYTQSKFRQIKGDKRQIGDSFFQLQKDQNGTVFCSNLNGQVFKVEEDSLSIFYESPKSEFCRGFTFSFDKKNNLIAASYFAIRKIDPYGKQTVLFDSLGIQWSDSIVLKDARIPKVVPFNNGVSYAYAGTREGLYMKLADGEMSLHQLKLDTIPINPNFFSLKGITFFKAGTRIFNLSTGQKDKSQIVWNNFTGFFQLDENYIIERSNSSGIRFITLNNGAIQEVKTSFRDKFISSIAKNDQNTLFLGTFNEGVLVVRNWKEQKNISKQTYSGITSSPNNHVYLSNRKGEIFKHENGPVLFYKKEGNIDELYYLNHKYPFGEDSVSKILIDKKHSEIQNDLFSGAKDLIEVDDDFFILTNGVSVSFLFRDPTPHHLPKYVHLGGYKNYLFTPNRRCQSLQFLKDTKTLFYSTSDGLFSLEWNSTVPKPIVYKQKPFLANDLEIYQGTLIAATEKQGLLFFRSGKFLKKITQNDGLSSNTISKIKSKNHLLFILGKNGLQVYDLVQKRIIEFGINEGLLADRVINFSLSGDKIWILDNEGYYSIDLEKIGLQHPVKMGEIYLDSILINDSKVSLLSFGSFSYDQNRFQAFFDYRDIETMAETKILYKLIGVSDNWKVLEKSTNSLEFPILPPGEYTFQIQAKFRDQESKIIQYNFSILPPIWLRWWFIALCVFIICIIISALFFIQLRRIKRARIRELKEQKLRADVFDSKLKAIRSQMNPHFIFNSMNSIQALVLRQDKENSYDYITMFSDLVRKTLHFSEQEYIQLGEEIHFLDIYLKLETLRMKEDFTYSITTEGEDSIQIPSLLIQPFIENSIHHGLLHKEGKKELNVVYACDGKSASCTIIDNGVGRSKAKSIKERQKVSHDSFSLNAVTQRLRILSQQNDQSYSYELIDLFNKDNEASGTKVIVRFPFRHQY